MGILDNLRGNKDKTFVPYSTVMNLSSNKTFNVGGGRSLTRKAATEPIGRVEPRELKLAYLTDPVVFNSINKMVQVMLYTGYKLSGDSEAIRVVDEFTRNLGNDGGMDWDTSKEVTLKNKCIFGSAYAEKVLTKGGDIVDLDVVDPENVDYAKDIIGNTVLDENNNPMGYIETLIPFVSKPKTVIEFPPGVYVPTGNALFVPNDRMLHFRLYTTGDGINSYGLVEPIYKNVQMKKNIEDSFASYLARLGYPILYGKLGDPTHEPTEEQLKNFLQDIKNIKNNDAISIPFYAELGILEPKAPEKMQEHLDYFNDEIISGLGIAKAFATGSGEETNRATLGRQEYLMKIGMKEILRRYSSVWEHGLFKPLCEQAGLETYPRMIWNEIALEELDSKSDRLQNYAKTGLIIPDKTLEKYIRAIEELPPADESGEVTNPQLPTDVKGE